MIGPALFLALDQGGHASRAIVFDDRGQLLAQALAPIATRRTAAGHIEHDPEEIIDSLRAAIGDVTQGIVEKGAITAAGLATQRSSIVCWNRETGAALSPVISWQDRRNAAFVETLRQHAEEIHARTGLVLSPHYGASKLRWCLQHIPKVASAADAGRLAFGPLSSFILFRLLAERPLVVDPANASRTQLWSPATRAWEPRLLEWFGISAEPLPQPVPSRHYFGTLKLGERSVPLSVCTGDQSAVPFAFGPARLDTAYVNIGTGAFIQCPLERAIVAPLLLSSVVWSDPRKVTYALEGTVNGAASALEWFAEREGIKIERLLAALPRRFGSESKPPLFLNGVSGLGSPFWVPGFESRFDGRGTVAEEFLAVLESILFLIRVNLDEMQQHRARLTQITVTGGLAASDFLCQSLANLTGLPVTRYAEHEATARGLAFLLADEPRHWPAGGQEVFKPELDTALLERFFAWLKALRRAIAPESR
jgi:glycerol kinase